MKVAAWDWSVMVVRVTALVIRTAILLATAALILQPLAQLLLQVDIFSVQSYIIVTSVCLYAYL